MSQINAYGAPHQNPHYSGTTVVPTTDVFRQLQIAGFTDVFAPGSSIYDRLTGLAEWSMQIMTPRQSRFTATSVEIVNYGDGLSSEATTCYLSLIMGFEAHNLTLSKRMAGAWADMGRPMGSFYASSGIENQA